MANNPASNCPMVLFGDFTREETEQLFGKPSQQLLKLPWSSVGTPSSMVEKDASALSDLQRQSEQCPSVQQASSPVPDVPSSPTDDGRCASDAAVTSPAVVATPTNRSQLPSSSAAPAPAATPWGSGQPSYASLLRSGSASRSNGMAATAPVPASTRMTPLPGAGQPLPDAGQPITAAEPAPPVSSLVRASVQEDCVSSHLGSFLYNRRLRSGSPDSLEVRGLRNRRSMCYVHATLQALLACPPLVSLLRDAHTLLNDKRRPCSSTPVVDAITKFVTQFKPVPPNSFSAGSPTASSVRQGGKKKRQTAMATFPLGSAFTPTGVYEAIPLVHPGLSVYGGKQQDAEEFLSALLNSLHDEMLSVIRSTQLADSSSTADSRPAQAAVACDDHTAQEWEEVSGRKNKSAVTRATVVEQSPMSALFGGEMRSAVSAPGMKESATLQPFMCLPLDVQGEHIASIADALHELGEKEVLQGYSSHVTGEQVAAARRISLSRLPPVLILHLKRFVYHPTEGSQKLQKHVRFGFNLSVNKELLAPNVRSCSVANAGYRLFAVVFHHGKTPNGGHYTCDVKHGDAPMWLRCNDHDIQAIPEGHVMQATADKTPYLLFYRRIALAESQE